MPPDDTNNKIWMNGRIIACSYIQQKELDTSRLSLVARIIDCKLLIEIEDL